MSKKKSSTKTTKRKTSINSKSKKKAHNKAEQGKKQSKNLTQKSKKVKNQNKKQTNQKKWLKNLSKHKEEQEKEQAKIQYDSTQTSKNQTQDNQEITSNKKVNILGWILRIVIFILILAIINIAILLFIQNQNIIKENQELKKISKGKILAENEKNQIIKDLESLISIPNDEQPIITEIKDAQYFKDQEPFFEDAQNNDLIVIFPKSRKIHIYREQDHQIINSGPIFFQDSLKPAKKNLNDNTQDNQQADAEAEQKPEINQEQLNQLLGSVKVEIRNGTKKTGLAGDYSDKLQELSFEKNIDVGNAQNQNFNKTVIINLSGQEKEPIIKMLTQEFEFEVKEQIPERESTSTADILIILGKDSITTNSEPEINND
ncbi:MAG: hypothetical protein GF332_04635 [Candidatus Moranbacteria bacterium]|nr:hypothetical protein [Candidatus Moranbacteria bacterium]